MALLLRRHWGLRLFVSVWLAIVVGSPINRAEGAERIRGPVAVLALIGDGDADKVVSFASEVHDALMMSGNIEVMPVYEVSDRLGRMCPAGLAPGDLDRMWGLLQQGYLQVYGLDHLKAVNKLGEVLQGLECQPTGSRRWDLFVKANILLGTAHAELRNKAQALRAFASVLRTRPQMKLTAEDYSLKTVMLWEEARHEMMKLPRGKLTVDCDQAGAEVFLDGVKVGRTPFKDAFLHGRYHLHVRHPDAGGFSRWVTVGGKAIALQGLRIDLEQALEPGRRHPAVRIPGNGDEYPALWPWLGRRLGVRHLVVVSAQRRQGRAGWKTVLRDTRQKGRRLRANWLEPTDSGSKQVKADAAAILEHLISGKTSSRVTDLLPEGQLVKKETWAPYYTRWHFLTSLAGAVASVSVGALFHIDAVELQDSADHLLLQGFAASVREQERADRQYTLAYICYGIGGAGLLIAGSIALSDYLSTTDADKTKENGPKLGLLPHPQGTSLTATFRF